MKRSTNENTIEQENPRPKEDLGSVLDVKESTTPKEKKKSSTHVRVSNSLLKELEKVGLKVDSQGRVVTLDGDPNPYETRKKYKDKQGLLHRFDA